MSAIPSISTAFITRPQALISTRQPPAISKSEETKPVAPVREPDRVELSPTSRGAVEPVEPVEGVQRAEVAAEGELSEQERAQVQALKASDVEVRVHEQAHVAAAGAHAQGGPTYSYQKGPDGNRYAVGGSVQIDSGPVAGDPQATIAKAQQVRRAALAPAKPSGADQQVAANASRMEAEARRELAEEQATEGASTQGTENASEANERRSIEGQPVNDEGEPRGNALDIVG